MWLALYTTLALAAPDAAPTWKHRAMPLYPRIASVLQVDGDCHVNVTIEEHGVPQHLDFVSCHAMFRDTVASAVARSRWQPARAGEVELIYRFTLSDGPNRRRSNRSA